MVKSPHFPKNVFHFTNEPYLEKIKVWESLSLSKNYISAQFWN